MTFNAKAGATKGSGEGGTTMLPCIRCKQPTAGPVLSLYGARCKACYDAYCRQPMAEFNASFKRGQPQRALPRGERELVHSRRMDPAQSVGDLLQRPEPPEYTEADIADMRRAEAVRESM